MFIIIYLFFEKNKFLQNIFLQFGYNIFITLNGGAFKCQTKKIIKKVTITKMTKDKTKIIADSF